MQFRLGLRVLQSAAMAVALAATACNGAVRPKFPPPSADAALARMKLGHNCVNGLFGVAKLDSFSSDGRIRGEVQIFAVNPDRVRFEVVSPFGATLYTLTSNGEQFQMLDTEKARFLEGPPSACNLARLTKVPVPAHALVTLLRGEAPLLTHDPGAVQMEWDADGFYRVQIEGRRGAREEIQLEVHPDDFEKPWASQRLRVKRVVVSQGGSVLYEADLGRHEAAQTAPPRVDPDGLDEPIPPSGGPCGAELPRSLRVRVPHSQQDLILQFKDAKWNPPLMPGTFAQPIPRGVRREYVECRGR